MVDQERDVIVATSKKTRQGLKRIPVDVPESVLPSCNEQENPTGIETKFSQK